MSDPTPDEPQPCERCGALSPTNWYDRDPYMAELYDETHEAWWCEDCYGDRCDDI
jgi:hypothetical protein